ncbi:squalene/phytoene synthase family protein [Salinibacterium sp. NSLL150]|uniref:phytoene/squalene synthase family protein n=1 Tax=unclassified Salinibacterium TaxID=2632331 RepID=UPI0018CFC703|nr:MULTISPECIES: squalene/phytoene synthase family protein [unclassified Salinibacterium]MBH0022890.1 squalene/phytoene synthase family protein [Salinibacterium sp. SWN248]MBH0097888.1 squalene/phytoene synthase family protein [Salinibacterium sp. NSLL35]MBH0100643.1 squalene/phytoene synthase family protein [Salinibacterium sp. NSLL150]MBH0103402.1 squalene/phytoene synthase family protein [Salinibacterium sp. NSLL16]MBH0106163.1 squalene/phytoene synthase family protein [Salinibacterium sp. 
MSSRLKLYDRVAEDAAGIVIRSYSTSFSAASRLLGADVRQHVENIYALVRVADEIVDGGAEEAGLDLIATGRQLNELERETENAIESGFSSNLIVHAFALTAREVSFGAELTAPFFESMRMDLSQKEHDQASFDRYVYGSAEVVGLMCLCAFLHGHDVSDEQRAKFEHGAQALGAAFQKVNFLRDLADDFETLGRSYFPGIDVASFTEAEKIRLLDDLDSDLRDAAIGAELPASSKKAVALAHSLFAQLSKRIRATPASELVKTRVRVPDVVKLRLAAAAAMGVTPRS